MCEDNNEHFSCNFMYISNSMCKYIIWKTWISKIRLRLVKLIVRINEW